MDTLVHSRYRNRRVKVIGRHDLHDVDALLLREQLAEIGICPAALVLPGLPLAGIVGVDYLPSDLSSTRAARSVFSPRGVPEQGPDAVTNRVLSPLHVVAAL